MEVRIPTSSDRIRIKWDNLWEGKIDGWPNKLTLSPCLQSLFLLLLLMLLLLLLLLVVWLLGTPKHRNPKSSAKVRTGISIPWETWLGYYLCWQGGVQCGMEMTRYFFSCGVISYWLRMHRKSLIKQNILLFISHLIDGEHKATVFIGHVRHG